MQIFINDGYRKKKFCLQVLLPGIIDTGLRDEAIGFYKKLTLSDWIIIPCGGPYGCWRLGKGCTVFSVRLSHLVPCEEQVEEEVVHPIPVPFFVLEREKEKQNTWLNAIAEENILRIEKSCSINTITIYYFSLKSNVYVETWKRGLSYVYFGVFER